MINDLTDKQVLVYGTGKSGLGAAELLRKKGAVPVFFDEKGAVPEGEKGFTGTLDPKSLRGIELAVLSPGVPLSAKPLDAIRSAGIPVIGEVELAYRLGEGEVLAITGTNGKTTTTALLGQIVSEWKEDAFVAGNIGTAYTTIADRTTPSTTVVLEVSSFQLETTDTFCPKVSAILNITEDHLDRHHTMEEYERVKERITERQGSGDYCVLNYEDERLRAFGERISDRIEVIWFSSARPVENGFYLDGEEIISSFRGLGRLLSVRETHLLGTHNYENIMAAMAMALAYGIPAENVLRSIKSFRAVAHRIEFVREVRGVAYYNDSKGTNPDAAIKGICAMERPTLLIGGGYDKGADYGPWIRAFGGKVKWLVLEGATAEAIREAALENEYPADRICVVPTMTDALDFCVSHAEEGDAVLLSPACASWGEFKNFEERGDRFKDYVANISD